MNICLWTIMRLSEGVTYFVGLLSVRICNTPISTSRGLPVHLQLMLLFLNIFPSRHLDGLRDASAQSP